MTLITIVLGILSFICFFCTSNGFWDEGHLLVAYIAATQLNANQIQLLTEPLKLLEKDYPGLNNLVSSAVWADHIKNLSSFDFGDVQGFQKINIFNPWHYTSIVWNPTNMKLTKHTCSMPYPKTGIVWALKMLWNEEGLRNDAIIESKRNQTANSKPVAKIRRSSAIQQQSVTYTPNQGDFAWNLRLRFITHLMGDLHQPLHVLELVSPQFPNGSMGGVLLETKVDDSPYIHNLHHVWDTCGQLYLGAWPHITLDTISEKAKKLMDQFPKAKYMDRLKLSFDSMASESFEIGRRHVYSELEINLKTGNGTIPMPYRPSANYINKTRDVCNERIVLAGYRLAVILEDIANVMGITSLKV